MTAGRKPRAGASLPKPLELAPGMAVVAEIKTGKRRVLDYLLSPLHRYGRDVLRER